MKSMNKFMYGMTAMAIMMTLNACSGMSSRDKSTAIGAGVGGVAGAVLTNGGALGTIGGAAIGGVIGNQIGKGKK